MKKTGLALALAATVSTSAMANDMYWGVGVHQWNFESSNDDLGTASILSITLGKDINENLAIEASIGTGVSDATSSITESGVSGGVAYNEVENRRFDCNYTLSLFAVAKADVTDKIGVYGKLGMAKYDYSYDYSYSIDGLDGTNYGSGSNSGSDSESDFSYGFGANYKVSDTSKINVEYMNWYDKNDSTIDGFGVTYQMNF